MIEHDLTPVGTDLSTISPHPRNPHNGDVDAIMRSIAKNGVYAPIVIQKSTRYVIKGNHTYAALMELGYRLGPVVMLDVDDERAMRILLTDNRIAQRGNDDPGLLLELLNELADSDEGLEAIGFGDDDLGRLSELVAEPLVLGDVDSPVENDVDNHPMRPFHYRIMPVVDDETGKPYEFVVSRLDEKPLTSRDLNRVRKGLGGIPLSKADLRQQGVPAWEK